jgi:uncharacterized membrane protein YesL
MKVSQNDGAGMPEKEGPIFPKGQDIPDKREKNIKSRFMDFYYDSVPYFSVNQAWFVMSLPVLTILPALGGLYYAVLSIEQGEGVDWGTVWEGIKKHWWLSLRWGILVLAVDILLVGNIWFYLNLGKDWAVIPLVITSGITILWFAINQFSFPLLLLQEENKIFLAIRNGFVVVMRQPLAALKVVVLTLPIAIVSIVFPPLWIFISMALIVRIRTRMVLNTIQKIRQKDETGLHQERKREENLEEDS